MQLNLSCRCDPFARLVAVFIFVSVFNFRILWFFSSPIVCSANSFFIICKHATFDFIYYICKFVFFLLFCNLRFFTSIYNLAFRLLFYELVEVELFNIAWSAILFKCFYFFLCLNFCLLLWKRRIRCLSKLIAYN